MLFEELICIVFYQLYTIHYELTLKKRFFMFIKIPHTNYSFEMGLVYLCLWCIISTLLYKKRYFLLIKYIFIYL